MNEKDLTTQRIQDVNLQEAAARYLHRLPQMPTDLNERVMERVAAPHRRVRPLWRWTAVAACLAAVFVVGYTLYNNKDVTLAKGDMPNGTEKKETSETSAISVLSPQSGMLSENMCLRHDSSDKSDDSDRKTFLAPVQKKVAARKPIKKEAAVSAQIEEPPTKDVPSPTMAQPETEGIHYASITTDDDKPKDPSAVTDPHLMEEFIDKMAAYLGVEKQVLDCPQTDESDAVGVGYVFPLKEDFDLFGRLLQVACRYDNTLPDYSLHFSQEQFLFELRDPSDGQKYIWFAEKKGRKILLYGSHASVGSPFSAACYQAFRDANVNNPFSYHL